MRKYRQCIKKDKRQQQVRLSWNVLERFGVNMVVGKTEVAKEHLVKHGEDEFHLALSDGTVWRANRPCFCEKNDVF